jgi:hypothetical protein
MSRPVVPARLRPAVRVLMLALLVLAVFWVAAFLLALLTAWLRGQPAAGAGLLSRGAVCGLIAALFVAVFHIKKEVLRLPVARREPFVERLKAHLGDLGYTLAAETAERLVFRPSFRSLLFGAGIEVRLAGASATVAGPKVYLEGLRRRLREQSYLAPAGRGERGGDLLRRVELSMRVSPEELHEIRGEVVGPLRAAGAAVVCHLCVLAQNEAGIPEAAVAEALGGWVREQGIPVEVHKERSPAPRPLPGPHRPPARARVSPGGAAEVSPG